MVWCDGPDVGTFFLSFLFLSYGAAEIVSSVEVHEAVGLASDDRIRITYDV